MNIPLCILPTKETLDFLCETPFVLPNSRIFSGDLAFKASGGELELELARKNAYVTAKPFSWRYRARYGRSFNIILVRMRRNTAKALRSYINS